MPAKRWLQVPAGEHDVRLEARWVEVEELMIRFSQPAPLTWRSSPLTEADWQRLTGRAPKRASAWRASAAAHSLTFAEALGVLNQLSREAERTPCYTLEGCSCGDTPDPGSHPELCKTSSGLCSAAWFEPGCTGYRLPSALDVLASREHLDWRRVMDQRWDGMPLWTETFAQDELPDADSLISERRAFSSQIDQYGRVGIQCITLDSGSETGRCAQLAQVPIDHVEAYSGVVWPILMERVR